MELPKLLVTGGCGFIGSNFVPYFLAKHHDAEIVNLSKRSCANSQQSLTKNYGGRYSQVVGDVTDFGLVSRLVEKVDAVVNFAGESHVDRSISSALPFFRSNTEGTIAILEALKRLGGGRRLVQISTYEVYGGIPKGFFTEADRTRPSSPYAASKAAAEDFCFAYHRTHGVDSVVCRSANNFGPQQFPEKLIPKTIIRAKLGLKIPVYGTGTNVREWIYVLDHCRAIESVLSNGVAGEVYNIATGEELMNVEVVTKILKYMGKSEDFIELVEDRPGHDIRCSLDSSKIRTELAWKPERTFDDALAETIDWYLDNEPWWKSLANEAVLHPTPWMMKW